MSKLDSAVNRVFLRLVIAVSCGSACRVSGETPAPPPTVSGGTIPGPATCATSGCHGGADVLSRQYVIWSQRDVHSRAYATLTSARAARMGEALKIAEPTKNASCTTCHAPLQTVAPELLAPNAHVEDGITCASCHGTGEGWLRSHTRTDWTHADRVAAGMHELRNLYSRANTCVACHQNIDPQLVKVGKHPQLIFELDGQAMSEPKHWRESATWHGAQAWYIGQAVALREMSGALLDGSADAELEVPRWQGLLWVLQRSDPDLPSPFANLSLDPGAAGYTTALKSSDFAARRAADFGWYNEMAKSALKNLAASHPAFLDTTVSKLAQAYRAERLVIAFDRLLASLPAKQRPAAASASLDNLFRLAQSIPDFSPADFARELAVFEKSLD